MIHSSYYTYHTNPQDLLRHISAAEGFGVSDDHSVYGLATYHCTSAHGPTCVQRGAVGELEVDEYVDPDLITNDDGAVIIQLGKDVDLGKLLRMFEGGKFDEAMRAARGKGGGGGNGVNGANGANKGNGNNRGINSASRRNVVDLPTGGTAEDSNKISFSSLDDDATSLTGRPLSKDQNPSLEGIRSTPSRETRRVEFLNAREKSTAMYWVDFNGMETHYVDLPPGMTTLMSTFATHAWVARDMSSTDAIALYIVRAKKPGDDGTQRFVVTDFDPSRVVHAAFSFGDEPEDVPPPPVAEQELENVGEKGDIEGERDRQEKGDIEGSARGDDGAAVDAKRNEL